MDELWGHIGSGLLGSARSDLERTSTLTFIFLLLKDGLDFKSYDFVFGFIIGRQMVILFLINCCLIAGDGGKRFSLCTGGTI